MRITLLTLLLFLSQLSIAQDALNRIGQTQGGASFSTFYDDTNQELIVGCGTSVWVFDCSDPSDIDGLPLLAKRPLMGLVNETLRYGDTIFAAATHDGLYALDRTDPQLPVLAHYPTPDDTASYDIWQTNDSIYMANGKEAVLLTYNEATFSEIERFGTNDVVCLGGKNNLLAVGSRGVFNGSLRIYDRSDLSTPLASWTSNMLLNIEDVQFADGNDSILYVAGGVNAFLTASRFFAVEFDGSALNPLDTFEINGLLGTAIPAFSNMDSRNDTVFVASTAGLLGAETNVPVFDCTNLSSSGSFDTIANIFPGLWHFDVAVCGNTDYVAISSEWYGLQISDFSDLNRYDTISVTETGGWGVRAKVTGDTVWSCQQGYGLTAYKRPDLLYTAPYIEQKEILHIDKPFIIDFTFIDDTLMVASGRSWKYYIYNMQPWLDGGDPELIDHLYDASPDYLYSVNTLQTDAGTRLIGGHANVLTGDGGRLDLRDPYDGSGYPVLASQDIGGRPNEIIVSEDTVWVGGIDSGQDVIYCYKVSGDAFSLISMVDAPGEVKYIAREGDLLATVCGEDGVRLYQQDGTGSISEIATIASGQNFVDADIKNDYLYTCSIYEGVLIYDISNPSSPVLVATGTGTGSWFDFNTYGSFNILVGDNGMIYLSDFHAGAIIYEAYDSTLTGLETDQVEPTLGAHIYPNPARDQLIIRLNEEGPFELEILSMTGKMVRNFQSQKEHFVADVSELNAGTYILKIKTEKSQLSRRIVIR